MITTAFVHLWNHRLGAVAWDAERNLASFEFDPKFLQLGLDVAPLIMPISQAENRIFSFPDLANLSTYKGLPGLLADVLPDKYGNAIINAWLAKNGRASNSLNPVELLCFIGKRGMGALEFEPVEPRGTNSSTKIELDGLINIAQEILSGRTEFNSNMAKDEEKALLDILKIGSSAGGARAKAVIAYNPITREVRSGQAEAPKGFLHYLIKFDGVHDQQFGASYGYGRVEMAYYLMALDAGINMMPSQLLEEKNRAHFMTQRYDRDPLLGKIHVQSLCALAHFDFNNINVYSYEQLFECMRKLRLPYSDAEQMYIRMVFNVLAKNCDDHTKNFAFCMDKQGIWSLAPAFDVCYSYRPDSAWVSQHSLSINGKRKGITREDLLLVAKNMNIKKANQLIEQVKSVVSNWNSYADKVSVDKELKKLINKNLVSSI